MSRFRTRPDFHRQIEELISELSIDYTIALVTHNCSRPRASSVYAELQFCAEHESM